MRNVCFVFLVTEEELNKTVLGDPQTISGKVTGLKPYTTYMVAVAVITQSGEGLQSDPLYNTTMEAGTCLLINLMIKNMLKRRKESGTYLATDSRHHRSPQIMMKVDKE